MKTNLVWCSITIVCIGLFISSIALGVTPGIDPGAYLNAKNYHPTVTDTTYHAPCIIEAEWFDICTTAGASAGKGITYNDTDPVLPPGDVSLWRADAPEVNIATNGNFGIAADDQRIVWSCRADDWYRYTFYVDRPGVYAFAMKARYGVVGTAGLRIDNDATNFSAALKADNVLYNYSFDKTIYLTAGKHVLTLNPNTNFEKISILEVVDPATYTGKPFHRSNLSDEQPHKVPGFVKVADFDKGGQGLAYNGRSTSNTYVDKTYRTDESNVPVYIAAGGSVNEEFIALSNAREWWRYTIENDAEGDFFLSVKLRTRTDFDGHCFIQIDNGALLTIKTPRYADNLFHYFALPEKIHLAAGKHVLTLNAASVVHINRIKITDKDETPIDEDPSIAPDDAADIVMNLIYGQSLSINGSITGQVDFYNTLMFKNGMYVNYTSESAAAAWYGTDFVPVSTTGIATPVRYMNKKYMECLRDENGVDLANPDFQLVGCAPGEPGAAWYLMADKDQIWYKRLLLSVQYAKQFTENKGKTFKVGCLGWMQGENSNDKTNTVAEYYAKLESIFKNLNSDIKEITGQAADVQFIVYQLASHAWPTQIATGATDGVPLALLKIAVDKPNVHLGPVLYPYNPISATDHTHQDDASVHITGAMFGIQAKRVLRDNQPTEPVLPTAFSLGLAPNGKYYLKIKFHVPVPPLVFDTQGLSLQNMRGAQPNMGFSLFKNGTVDIIESVSLTGADEVTICSSENPIGKELYYAKTGIEGGGNLHDSQGDVIKVDIAGKSYGCYNWAPIFKQNIANMPVENIEDPVGIQPVASAMPFSFYPNPVKGVIYFSTPAGKLNISDLTGRLLLSQSFENGQANIASLKEGTYLIRLETEGKVLNAKIIRN